MVPYLGGNIDIGAGASLLRLRAANPNTSQQNAAQRMLAEDSQTLADVRSLDIHKIAPTDLKSMLKQLEGNDPLLGQYLSKFEKAGSDLQQTAKEYAALSAAVPKEIHVKGTQRLLGKNDPLLNQPIEEVKTRIAMEGQPQYESQKRIAQLRDALIAYNDEGADILKQLADSNDPDQSVRALAQASPLSHYLPVNVRREASRTFCFGKCS